jgi:hypothetical protein
MSLLLFACSQMRLDRDTLVQWYKTSADQLEAILPGFLVRVKGTMAAFALHSYALLLPSHIATHVFVNLSDTGAGDQYVVGRITACQQDTSYRHNLMGSLVCNKSLLVRVSGMPAASPAQAFVVLFSRGSCHRRGRTQVVSAVHGVVAAVHA